MEELILWVKTTNNYPPGLPRQTFELLSPVWSGASLTLPCRDVATQEPTWHEVTGWTDVFRLGPCPVHVAKVRTETGRVGYVIYGGTAGVRVLDTKVTAKPGTDEYLPAGRGLPFLWLALEHKEDLPNEVRQVVNTKG